MITYFVYVYICILFDMSVTLTHALLALYPSKAVAQSLSLSDISMEDLHLSHENMVHKVNRRTIIGGNNIHYVFEKINMPLNRPYFEIHFPGDVITIHLSVVTVPVQTQDLVIHFPKRNSVSAVLTMTFSEN